MCSSGATCDTRSFEVFDRPDTNASCPQRAVTTIAPQALSLLNSPLAHDAARALAARVAVEVTVIATRKSITSAGWFSVVRLTLSKRTDDERLSLLAVGRSSISAWRFSIANAFVYVD